MNPQADIKRTERLWSKVRKVLKVEFEKLGITFCEQCGSTFNLRFCHRYKRRFIITLEELKRVALLCEKCDVEIEYAGHDVLYEEITNIIENRKEAWWEPA
jgi:hypothetical protein